MSILSKEQLINTATMLLSENTSDTATTFIEDLSDTMSELENNSGANGGLQARFDDLQSNYDILKDRFNDLTQRYRERFINGGSQDDDINEPEDKPLTFEDLFEEVNK